MSTLSRRTHTGKRHSSKRTKAMRWAPGGLVLTPGRTVYVLLFWLLGPINTWLSTFLHRPMAYYVYGGYFTAAFLMIAWGNWPRRDPVAEGLRRAYRLLPLDPGMALVRGRGALEHSLFQAVENLGITVAATDGQVGIFDLLTALKDDMPSDLYNAADYLRRLANEAAHNPDVDIERAKARQVLKAAAQMRRWVRRQSRGVRHRAS